MRMTKYLLVAGCFSLFAFAATAEIGMIYGQPIPQTAPVFTTASPRGGPAQQAARTGRTGPTAPVQQATGQRAGAAVPVTTQQTGQSPSRAVTTRAGADNNRAVQPRGGNQARTVVARTATTPNMQSRISLSGTPIRGQSSATGNLFNRLYTGTVTNVIDPTTGLISADAYANCLNSYYACMDEICTARNPGQRRCACAGRVRAFNEVEAQLQSAREDLLRVSGELTLFIASGGRQITAAFTLTDAEKVMNCASWNDVQRRGNAAEMTAWCENHMYFGGTTQCSLTVPPQYCSEANFGLGANWWRGLSGSESSIQTALAQYANQIQNIDTITLNNDNALLGSMASVTDILNQISGGTGNIFGSQVTTDVLANTWGYSLFQYAHNNVCNRVLDACFNGIYETCGNPGGAGTRCPAGQNQCPFNYNTIIQVNNNDIDFVTPGGTGTAGTSAACYGYTGTSGDPYAALRRPIADARRSILQKYALDANADCDVYGEELRRQVQNVQYQKIAATQLLQSKRLEFAQADEAAILSEANSAMSNFSECISQIYECYGTQFEATRNTTTPWTPSRIRTYCVQMMNAPACYQPMICNPSAAQFRKVIDVQDSTSCNNIQERNTNTCRNVVTLQEILSGVTGAGNIAGFAPSYGANMDSAKLREFCISQAIGTDHSIRTFGTDWGVINP
ncbi:MAG: hypothetical protein FWE52_02655 [Alphaproteobacteria bacterium]|nr:hypothetical protein [Alphaproteobacteria bacterium]